MKSFEFEKVQKTIIDNIYDKNMNNDGVIAYESLGGNEVDYKTFFEMVDVYARGYKELGIENGDMVTICSAGTLDTVLNFSALNKIGAVVQFVNPNYFKYNSKKYIDDVDTKLFVCLDRFYPVLKKAISQTNIENILISSMSQYSSFLYKMLIRKKKVKNSDKIAGVNYIELDDLIKLGENSSIKLERIPYEADKPAVITYTSGTTGNPKGVVHTNDSINNMLSIYQVAGGFGIGYAERNLVLIPPMYLTSFVHSIYGPMSVGATNILQPIYNPKELGKDIKKYEPKTVVASKAHYINLEDSKLPKGSLSSTKYAYCGGEAISKSVAIKINEILEYYGITPMVIGYGQTEFGTMVMFNYDIPNRINESGMLIPEVNAKIVDLVTGEVVQEGQRGELYIQTPAMMKEYLNMPDETSKFFVMDDNNEVWAKTGDVAEVKYQYDGKDVYEVSGRCSDSFVDKDGNVIYLFDIENEVENIKYVREAEVIAATIDGNKVPLVHVVLEKNSIKLVEDVLKIIDLSLRNVFANKNAIPYAYKIRDSFATSPISGKRDYESLIYEKDGYWKFNEGVLEPVEIIAEEAKNHNEIVHSKILIKK